MKIQVIHLIAAIGFTILGLISLMSLMFSFNAKVKDSPFTIINNSKLTTKKVQLIGLGVFVALLILIATGWIVVSIILMIVWGAGIYFSNLGKTKVSISKLEDIATWTELLRDLFSSSAGLAQTIVSSYDIAPESLKPGLFELNMSIKSGNSISNSIYRFADWLDDPVGDLVCAVLMNAADGKAFKIANLLSDLAESTRQEVTMLLHVEAARSSTKASVRTITWFSASFFIGLAVLAKSYMSPYQSFVGQMVLVFVLLIYLTGIMLMQKMSSFQPKERLLG